MNLATAQSATRSREIGVRKVIGAKRSGLITHFIFESILLSFIGLLFALVAVQFLLPFFNEITGKSMRLDFTNPVFVISIFTGRWFRLLQDAPAFYFHRSNGCRAEGTAFKRISGSAFIGRCSICNIHYIDHRKHYHL
jgi:hypothetical protein